jgi:hypothetical protein
MRLHQSRLDIDNGQSIRGIDVVVDVFVVNPLWPDRHLVFYLMQWYDLL